jgi:hypothetical protein
VHFCVGAGIWRGAERLNTLKDAINIMVLAQFFLKRKSLSIVILVLGNAVILVVRRVPPAVSTRIGSAHTSTPMLTRVKNAIEKVIEALGIHTRLRLVHAKKCSRPPTVVQSDHDWPKFDNWKSYIHGVYYESTALSF